MFCSQCGNKLQEGGKFCSSCGSPVNLNVSAAAEAKIENSADILSSSLNLQEDINTIAKYENKNFSEPTNPPLNFTLNFLLKKRSLVVFCLLCVFTLGIYPIVWYYSMFNEGKLYSNDCTLPSGGKVLLFLLVPFLNIIGVILVSFIWFPRLINACERKAQIKETEYYKFVLLIILLPMFYLIYMQYRFNCIAVKENPNLGIAASKVDIGFAIAIPVLTIVIFVMTLSLARTNIIKNSASSYTNSHKLSKYESNNSYTNSSNNNKSSSSTSLNTNESTYSSRNERISSNENHTNFNDSYYNNTDFVIPFSSTKYLTSNDLTYLTKYELSIARNEIFARHGYVFNNLFLKDYFTSKSWYYPNSNFKGNLDELNEYEKYNVNLIKQYEAKKQ